MIQAKQREHVAPPAENLSWLKGQVRDELNAWMDTKSKRDRFPQYVLFITNVRLSAEVATGGVDQIQAYVDELVRDHGAGNNVDTPSKRGLRAVKVWHRDKLNALIANNQSIRAAFPAILTVGDVLTRLYALPGSINADDLAPVLREQASSTLRNDRWIRFGEAGGLSRQSVERVIVDLPARVGDRARAPVLGACLERGNLVLRRSVSQAGSRHLVVTGAAGNGKSTLATYLTQVYRSCFLRDEGDLPATANEVIAGTSASLERLNLSAPTNRRWPLNVSLPDMAKAMGPSGGPNLLRWLAQQITERASIEVQPVALWPWLQPWPCVLFSTDSTRLLRRRFASG